jgi:hypothetical protein
MSGDVSRPMPTSHALDVMCKGVWANVGQLYDV